MVNLITDLPSILAPISSWLLATWPLLALTILVVLATSMLRRPPFPANAPPVFDAYPFVGALRFFSHRTQLIEESRSRSKTGNASFYYGKHQIVSLAGTDGRRTFFENRGLDIDEGYAGLFNATPKVNAERPRGEAQLVETVKRNLVKLMRKDVLASLVPALVHDARQLTNRLRASAASSAGGPSGDDIDPFDDIYLLIYQFTMRTFGSAEIADNEPLLRETLSIFESIDGASAAAKLLVPWVPAPSHLRRMWAGFKMYSIFGKIVGERKKSGERKADGLQMLIDHELPLLEIVSIVITALFAGQVNTGITTAYLLCFLAQSPPWQARIHNEIDDVVAKHRVDPSQSPIDILAQLPLDAWEAEFASIDLALRETIRFVLVGCAFRQNVSGSDIKIGATGEVIPRNAFAVYLLDDIHFNSKTYDNPNQWDPSRYESPRAEDKKEPHGFVGWGSGRNPCLGIRFAKLETKILIATLLSTTQFALSQTPSSPNNQPFSVPDIIDRDEHTAHKPKRRIRLKYSLR